MEFQCSEFEPPTFLIRCLYIPLTLLPTYHQGRDPNTQYLRHPPHFHMKIYIGTLWSKTLSKYHVHIISKPSGPLVFRSILFETRRVVVKYVIGLYHRLEPTHGLESGSRTGLGASDWHPVGSTVSPCKTCQWSEDGHNL
jgi:hypothetical protein